MEACTMIQEEKPRQREAGLESLHGAPERAAREALLELLSELRMRLCW